MTNRKSVWLFIISILSLVIVSARPSNKRQAGTLGSKPEVFRYLGICEPSAAVALGPNMFLVANDNDNFLRVYSTAGSSSFIHTFVLSQFYPSSIKDGNNKEKTDIEGAAWQGNKLFWIGSHSTTNDGDERLARRRIFAHEIKFADGALALTPLGNPYTKLLDELNKHPKFKDYHLGEAALKPAKAEGALSIEGLAAMPKGGLLIGFRNPLINGQALLAPLLNPTEVMNGAVGSFGAPIVLDLGGFGIRDIAYWNERQSYIIIAGPSGENTKNESYRLYRWAGAPGDKPEEIKTDKLQGLNPEAIVIYTSGTESKLLILSDDGNEPACKTEPGFRSIWLSVK